MLVIIPAVRPLIIAGIGLATMACNLGAAPPPADLPPWKMGRDSKGAEARIVSKGPYTYFYALDGRLVQLNLDSGRDGKPDVFAYFTGNRTPDRVETDSDSDGRVDRWEHYDAKGVLSSYSSSRNSERPDRTVVLDPATGRTLRVESDLDGDGRMERIEVFSGGVLVRAEIDANRDGRADRIQEWKDGRLLREDLDQNGDGRPEIRLVHDRSGGISRVESLVAPRP